MITIVLPDGSAAEFNEVTAHGMVFRGESRYVGEKPRRFGDLSGHPLIGSVCQRFPAPQDLETKPASEPTTIPDHPHGAGAHMNWIETQERQAAEAARVAQASEMAKMRADIDSVLVVRSSQAAALQAGIATPKGASP